MNQKTLLTLAILSAGCAFSTTSLAANQKGEAKQELCVVLENDAPTALVVKTHAYTLDVNNESNPMLQWDEEFEIPAGALGGENTLYCGKKIAEDELKGQGELGWQFKVYRKDEYQPDGQMEPIDEMHSTNYFHGGGKHNKWDLSEFQDGVGRCNDGKLVPGVHLEVQSKDGVLREDCREWEVPNGYLAKVKFTPDLSNVEPDDGDDGDTDGEGGNPSPYPEYYGADQYPWPESWNYVHGDRVFQPLDGEVYQCEQEGWCNQDPNAYSPGTGWAETDANPDNNAWSLVPRTDWETK